MSTHNTNAQHTNPPTMKAQKGSIGVVGAAAIGVGGMMGAGLYTLVGLASASAGARLPLSFFIGGIVAAFSVYSYSKLGMKFPSRGGSAQFLVQGFGNGLVAGGMNIFQYFGWIIAIALYAAGFSDYAKVLFGLHDTPWVAKAIGVGIIAVAVIINIFGSKLVARTQTTIIAVELIILVVFVAVGLTHVKASAFSDTMAKDSGASLLRVLSAAGLLYVTYEGFGVVTNAAGSMAHPAKQLPRAMYLALGVVMVVYMASSVVVIGSIGASGAEAAEGHALADAGRAVMGSIGFTAIGVAALVATASAVNSTMFGDENLGMRIADVNEIPPSFRTPTRIGGNRGIFATALFAALFVDIFPLSAVGQLASLAFLLVYATVNLGHLRLVRETGAKRWILVASVVLNLVLFVLLFSQTILHGEVLTWVALVVLFVASFAAEWWWRGRTGQDRSWISRQVEPAEAGPAGSVGSAEPRA